jgi:hypothetical protein
MNEPTRPFGIAAIVASTVTLLACASTEALHPASHAAACRKVDPQLARILADKHDEERVGVVVELSVPPRARDVLWAGVADCLPSPSIAGAGEPSGGVPWVEWELEHPLVLPVMCVGWATRHEVARWCNDETIRHVEAWHSLSTD